MLKSRVVIVKGNGTLMPDGRIDQSKVLRMYEKGVQLLTGKSTAKEGFRLFFKSNDRVGIKINTIGGKKISSCREVTFPLANKLIECGIRQRNIFIWDRSNRELREAGYLLNLTRRSLKVLGTDTQGVGYDYEPISHLNIGSRFSMIQLNKLTASISLAVLKDHGLAGVTAGMKNYFGIIHNPNKYHDSNCDPFIAELFDTQPIKDKHRLSILDCLVVQFHRGPAYHARWAKKYESFIFSLDPVAADYVGWQVIEKLRAEKNLPSLREENREPKYLKTAEQMRLGKANAEEIEIIEEEI